MVKEGMKGWEKLEYAINAKSYARELFEFEIYVQFIQLLSTVIVIVLLQGIDLHYILPFVQGSNSSILNHGRAELFIDLGYQTFR